MRFCVIKIILLINILLSYSYAIQAKEYDLSFDVKNKQTSKQREFMNSEPSPLSNSWRLGMQASLLPDFLEGTGEIVYGNFDDPADSGAADWNKYLLTLGVGGKKGIFGYGFNYYSVGQEYNGNFNSKYRGKKGREGYDSWLSLNINKLTIKAKYLESWTNTSSSNLTNAHTFDSWYEIETSYPITSSPFTEIAVSYGLGNRRSYASPNYIQTYQGSLDSFKTKFRYVDDNLKFSTELRHFSSSNKLNDHKDLQRRMVYFSSTLFPNQIVSLISSYRYSIDTHSNDTYKNKLNKMESSLGFVYKAVTIPTKIKLTSGYNNYESSNGYTRKDILNLGAQFDWESVGDYSGLRTDWTINLNYKDTVDHISPASSNSGYSINLMWKWPIF